MLGWSFSPDHVPWMPHSGSPFPLRSYSDPSDQSPAKSYIAVEQSESHTAPTGVDLHSDSRPTSSVSLRTAHPPIAGGKVARLTLACQNSTHIKPSHLNIVENAASSGSDDLPSPKVATPVSKAPSTRGSLGSRRRSVYPGSSSSGTATPGSNSLSPLSVEFRSEMDMQIFHYVKQNDRRVKEVMDERLPMIFNTCKNLLQSMHQEKERVSLLKKYRSRIAGVDSRGHSTTAQSNPVHDFGRLPTREFRQPHVTADWKPPVLKRDEAPLHSTQYDEPKWSIKEETESVQNHDKNEQDDIDVLDTHSPAKLNYQDAVVSNNQHLLRPKALAQKSPSPTVFLPISKLSYNIPPSLKPVILEPSSLKELILDQAPVAHVGQRSPTNTVSDHEHDAKQSSSCESSARKRKRDQESSSDQVEPARVNAALQPGSTIGIHAAIAIETSAGAGRVVTSDPASASEGQSVTQKERTADSSSIIHSSSSLLIDKKANPLTLNNFSVASIRAVAIDWGKEFYGCLQSFQECCVYIMISLQQPQTASCSDPGDIDDLPPSKISTPMHRSERSNGPTLFTPLPMMNFQNAPPSIKMKLKGEVSKVIKGVNDILAMIEKSDADRAELLTKIETYRANMDCSTRSSRGKDYALAYDDDDDLGAASMTIVGRDNALAQMEHNLQLLDLRQASRVQCGVMELQSSCAGLYQMLRTVFV
ncbi:hypothetical protein EC991_002196 [Linnemannia zychae]|nr:hypothetical protein EC991_002196 [Linnemannia zychae]